MVYYLSNDVANVIKFNSSKTGFNIYTHTNAVQLKMLYQ
jgi:hypothetical protein